MYKLYDPQRTGIIGPRFEHAVRNAMLTVMSEKGSTFVEIVRVLTDPKYVQELLPKFKTQSLDAIGPIKLPKPQIFINQKCLTILFPSSAVLLPIKR